MSAWALTWACAVSGATPRPADGTLHVMDEAIRATFMLCSSARRAGRVHIGFVLADLKDLVGYALVRRHWLSRPAAAAARIAAP